MYFRNFWPLAMKAEESAQEPAAPVSICHETKPQPELIDPKDELKKFCGKKRYIAQLLNTLEECNKRVNSRQKTSETCEQELCDYVYAMDHCVATKLFNRLS